MKRQTFLTIAAAIAALFAVMMLASPGKMIEGAGGQQSDTTNVVFHAMGIMLLSLSIIIFIARKDEGSIALRAILIGNIVMHVATIPIDWIAWQQGTFTQFSGLIPGSIVHAALAVGFFLCLKNLPGK